MLDWASFILEANGHAKIAWLQFVSDAFLILSFVLLLQFAINLLSYRSERKMIYRLIPGFLVTVGVVALIATRAYDTDQIALCVRRSFGYAGALLSGVAFCKLAVAMRAIGNARV